MPMRFALAIPFLLFATSAPAETLDCVQRSLSSVGFSSASTARSWFPERFKVKIEGEKAISDYYGLGSIRRESGRKYITFVLADTAGSRTEVKITFIEKNSRYTSNLGAVARTLMTAGAKGRCSVS